jgi:hypothetical protein
VVLSGGFGAVSAEPGWLATIIGSLPVRPVVHSVTLALHSASEGPVVSAHDLVVLAAWAAAGVVVAPRWFVWAPRSAGSPAGPDAAPVRYSRT